MVRSSYRRPIQYASRYTWSSTADGYPRRFRAIITIGGTGEPVRRNSLNRTAGMVWAVAMKERIRPDGTVPNMMRRSRWWTPKKLPAITSPELSPI
ncbi:hypothetical protein NITHO_3120006 [Nitrolancea hollandica Lb]|uniref:Uncharacterized protein n=1 Tax=Nitrolancea hollandica Lb TaxID=1129897 RepID=I4EHI2_9BACT|nr:hypothetical protein NITHO_3120006 [Nitrolancea hollandica Lb]